ncbi:CAP N multi-domain protein [Pyrenophora teres f. teres]|uniref:CAP N multi-domain protein n=1 Tax=Pyrenophora teres f. teres TaxID=97479 RepID=A0A6S6W9G5_9PLEO|nr:CAP N multi-domain protein [Pyrenophora teres f. teres]
MRSAVAFAVAALAGSAFAAPQLYGNVNVVEDPDHDQLHFGPSSDPRANSRGCLRSSSRNHRLPSPPPPPAPTSSTPTPTPTPDFTPAPAPPPPAPPAPAPPAPPAPAPAPPAPTATEAAKAPPSSGGYIDIVIEWRAKMGLPALEIDLRLQANALTTIQHSGGAMKHELNPGTMAQVMAPGECTLEGFGGCYLGGWLCEKPQLKGLDGVCHKASKGWEYNGQTDHAEILVSTNYGKIGCSCDFNMWACDLA